MKPYPGNRSTPRFQLLSLVLMAAGLVLPLPSLAGSVALATSPLATSTTSSVKPNLLLLLDNSGSMSWEHMPDDVTDLGSSVTFSYGYYGLRSSQCNQVYYDPDITYLPPVSAAGTNYSDALFTGALPSGYQAAGTTIVSAAGDHNYTNTAVPLSTGFKASLPASYTSVAGDTLAQSAYYYAYSGAQTTPLQKNYNSTINTFYSECHNSTGGSVSAIAPVSGVGGVFTKHRLATAETTTITISGTGGTTSPYASVSGITVNGAQIMKAASATASGISSSTMATNIAAQINLCTAAASGGNCAASGGYSASASSGTVTITGPTSAADYTPVISTSGGMGSITLTADVFPDTTAANLTNFANWYSYYRTRMLMMKSATGRAFKDLNQNYRVGLMRLSTNSAPTVYVNLFWDNSDTSLGAVSTQRTDWYTAFYGTTASASTPLRQALSNAGRYYAGKLAGVDPMQYSCQQNFTILSTDGFWNGTAGFQVDGSTAVGDQDATAGRPMYDGTIVSDTWTNTYTRNDYSSSGTKISGGSNCSGTNKRLLSQPEICSCTVTVAGTDCASACSSSSSGWSNNGSKVYVAPYTSSSSSCTATVTIPSPDPSARVRQSSVQNTSGGSSDSLADVAMYYYQTDLRTEALNNCGAAVAPATVGPLCENNVFTSGLDKNLQQHMNTFTLGLGASGKMTYSSSYLNDTSGDYVAVKLGSTADSTATPPVCSWQANGTVCNWPVPGMSGSDGLIENIDDLWHAAVNGRGVYFSATNPTTLSSGLSSALASVNAKVGAAAAAATSTLNPVAGNNFAYVASYTTVAWKGNLEARGINVDTGAVSENASWCVENVAAQTCIAPATLFADTSGSTTAYYCVTYNAAACTGSGEWAGADCRVPVATACTGTMGAKVFATSDTRAIKTADSAGTALIDFDDAYATANPANFAAAHISTLTQWSSLDAVYADQKLAAAGVNLLRYLRGQNGYEFNRTVNPLADWLYRNREAVLGDALESQPAFIGAPLFSYSYPGYSEYLTAQSGRAGTVYMGANDGMMHAFAASNGQERWAYVPSMVIPNMWKLADTNYSNAHANFVNGSPITSDICTANCSNTDFASTTTTSDDPIWKTILVAGLNGGGRGYFALDITVPDAPALLWEFKPTAATGRPQDVDLGYSFGLPIITRKADGTWVVLVTSGYDNGTLSSDPAVNNSPAGSGIGYLYVLDAATGAIISKISTGVGTAGTPSGLAKIAGWNAESGGNLVSYVYGGDLLGNVWRFDINSTTAAATGTGEAMQFATLFSNTAGTSPQPVTTTPVLGNIAGKRVIFIGTGKYLETGDLSTTQTQTQYAIKDDNATSPLVNPRTALVNQTLTNNPDGTATRIASSNTVNFFTDRGWYVDFPDGGSGGVGAERANIDAKLVQGTLLVPTIVPSNTVCAPGGYGWLNFLNYKTGGPINPGTSIASAKYDSTIVGINVLYIQGQPQVEVVTSTNPTPKKDPDVVFSAAAAGFTGKRMTWRELIP